MRWQATGEESRGARARPDAPGPGNRRRGDDRDQRTNGLDEMADEQNGKPRQLTDTELNREITEHQQLLKQPLSQLQRQDVETALRAFLLDRDQRHTARAAYRPRGHVVPEPSASPPRQAP
jgi:hypothetical protein